MVPLPAERAVSGLLGVFRPTSRGEFPGALVKELAARAPDLGRALELSLKYGQMENELHALRLKERVRDIMLDPGLPELDRWSRLLDVLLEELPADFAHFHRLSEDGERLSLLASAGPEGPLEGWLSFPAGLGFLGSTLRRGRLRVYSCDDSSETRDLYVLPLSVRRGDVTKPLGVLVFDGAQRLTLKGEDAAAFLESIGAILSPLLFDAPGRGRA
jgi:hypothetical protein